MTHHYTPDPRNANVLVYVNGSLIPRPEARISVFDSGFLLGDGVWESFRLRQNRLLFFEAHMNRLFEGCAALDIDPQHTRDELLQAVVSTIEANKMTDNVHIRLIVSRGLRATPYQDPNVVVSPPTVVIIAEHKQPVPTTATHPLNLFTVHVRRGRPDVQDAGYNNLSKINCITACIQANKAGADEALMLDPDGFVATCNSTHFFIVRDGEVWTSTGVYCLDGITRGNVIKLCERNSIPIFQRTFSLTRVYGADEAFVTGTFAGVSPVGHVDGRKIGTGSRGPITHQLQQLYLALCENEGLKIS